MPNPRAFRLSNLSRRARISAGFRRGLVGPAGLAQARRFNRLACLPASPNRLKTRSAPCAVSNHLRPRSWQGPRARTTNAKEPHRG